MSHPLQYLPSSPWNRTRFLLTLLSAYLGCCFLQRIILIGWIAIEGHALPSGILPAFLKGLIFDLATSGFLFLPAALFLALAPAAWRDRRFGLGFTLLFSLAPLFLGLLSIALEFFFWEEFHARYNFIAVDYLVYTHEVVRNIWESYPVVWFFLGMGAIVAAIAWKLRARVLKIAALPGAWAERPLIAGTLALLLLLNFSLNEDAWLEADSFWGRELAKNSLYALFSAYNRNSIDYKQFYISQDSPEARRLAHEWFSEGKHAGEDPHSLARDIPGNKPEKEWNIVLVAIESMSARFLSHYGSERPITPNLDRMADEGIFFNKLYATGSRTVRGLEALMLSLPPTPGQSILRRPNSGNLFNLGSVFASRNYRRQFVYGGYAHFDNMREWFSSNGFEIVDKGEFAPGGVHFATAWGACDEDLFDESLRRADEAHSRQQHFFQVLLTTSNHRPYDFPGGRIDIPSHSGRDGAVKYTDFAIGRFLEQAKTHVWYKNTLFIFLADHNASVAGGTDIPVRDYLIPVIFYNPELVKPQVISKLSSQIDIAPTLLSLLGFPYRSWFFGQDLFTAQAGRALLGTYQKVALLEPGIMTVLEPGRKAQIQELGPEGQVKKTVLFDASKGGAIPDSVKRASAIYQSASELFSEGLSKLQPSGEPK